MSTSSEPNPVSSPKPVASLSPKLDDSQGLDSRALFRHKIATSGRATPRYSRGLALSGPAKSGSKNEQERAGLIFARNLWARWQRYRSRLRDCRKLLTADSVHQLRVATRRLLAFVSL